MDCWGGFIDNATSQERSSDVRPTPPLELAEQLKCPLLAAIGEQLRERAGRSGQEVKVDEYEGAGHAFFADYRPTYRPGPAAALWREIVPFLWQHLGTADAA